MIGPLRSVFVTLFVAIAILSINASVSLAQKIYSKAYGHKGDPAIIYLHGGPRGNSTLFEGTTATALAERGFYVIVYDRRGEGRSIDNDAKITFDEAFIDLNNLIKQYDLPKVTLLSHSFGGIVSTLFTDKFPEKVERLVLIGGLFSQQESYDHILTTSLKMAAQKGDSTMLKKIAYINSLSKQSEQYRKQTYEVASHFGFFKMPKPTDESKKLNDEYEKSSFSKANIRNDNAPVLFYKNESRVNIDTKPILKAIIQKKIKLSAIYGLQDGIFSKKQLSDMQNITGAAHFFAIENCSHYPFVDQQAKFLEIVEEIMGK